MSIRLILYGLGIWSAATLWLRLRGQQLLHPGNGRRIAILFALSFPLIAWLVRRLCSRIQTREEQFAGAIAILLPTLLLDPFSSAFFPQVFPNIAPEMAGVFGGWMLWCCAGGLIGVAIPRRPHV
jgi:hypothetical protein